MAQNLWTLMFYFAGDNNLAPGMLSQLKAIKDAGFHERVPVIVRYDPNQVGALTMTFDINKQRKEEALRKRDGDGQKDEAKKKRPVLKVGDGGDPFVHNLMEDVIRPAKRCQRGGAAVQHEHGPKKKDGSPISQAAHDLCDFLEHVREKYPAEHYVLFLVGHGMIVGNDAFLPDERPNSAIELQELGLVLRDFTDRTRAEDGSRTFEVVGMHSCSMSAVEVAYELKDTAHYMMATEGISFIGSLPYRQLLKKFFKTLDTLSGDRRVMGDLLIRLFALSRYNSTDFMFGGFSADLALCNLDAEVVDGLTPKLRALTAVLKEGLGGTAGGAADKRVRELILLSHWNAQSYWQENYTDLYDFCLCLWRECSGEDDLQKRVAEACFGVMETIDPWGAALALQPKDPAKAASLLETAGPPVPDLTDDDDEREGAAPPADLSRFNRLVVCSKHFGPAYQYSHGLSIYFPWARPVEDSEGDVEDPDPKGNPEGVLDKYRNYAFTTEFRPSPEQDDSWLSFLELYFAKTMRRPRLVEDGRKVRRVQANVGASFVAAAGSALAKTTPSESGGDGCTCPSIKNYVMEFLEEVKPEKPYRGRGDG